MDGRKPINEVARENPCCGYCMFLLPNTDREFEYGCNQPGKMVSGKGKGQRAYWMCKCESAEDFHKGRVYDDGTQCKHFRSKYDDDEKTNEWIAKCYEERNNRKKARIKKTWKKFA